MKKSIIHNSLLTIAALTLSGAAISTVQASLAPGSKPKDWPANPDKHQVSIQRTAANETEKKMITAAEAALPLNPVKAEAGKNALPPAANKPWWHKEVVGVKIPYAITAEAVDYYSELVEGRKKLTLNRFLEPTSSFSYKATVSIRDNQPLAGKVLPKVYVVKMKLSFQDSFTAGQCEAFRFEKEREVILDPDGKVLQITGDGAIDVPVMCI